MHTGDEEIRFLESVLFEALGHTPKITDTRLVTGGSINTAVRLATEQGTYFVKWSEAHSDDLFRTEARGLDLLAQTGTFTIPRVIHQGKQGYKAYLMLEFIEPGPQRPTYWKEFGESLAQLHSHTHSTFGLDYSNYIGTLPQRNTPRNNAVEFFIEERLKVQAGMALYNNMITPQLHESFQKLYEALPGIIPNERPALVHGDLWSGNVITDADGGVCLVDPAPHYGIREAEIAFTFLFGGFDPTFYQSYNNTFPMEDDFEQRVPIYNLYPLLVHVNLFGHSYVKAVEKVLSRF